MAGFRVLGPVELWTADGPVELGPRKQRSVLAVLLTDVGRVVGTDQLIDRVWGDAPPAGIRSVVYTHVSRLRRVLAAVEESDGQRIRLTRRSGGYLLDVDPGCVDLYRFRQLVAAARAAREPASAAGQYRDALELWRGAACADLSGRWFEVLREELEAERTAAMSDRIDVELRLGRHSELLGELRALTARHPLDERLAGQLMLASYRAGRQAEALGCYQLVRRHLVDELGVEPGPDLRRLYERILRNEPALTASMPDGLSATPGPRPAQLPHDTVGFTGRARELAELRSWLLDSRPPSATTRPAMVISAIEGTAGVGKTALAVHFGHSVRDLFPDGQLYVDLRGYAPGRPVRPIEALALFLRALGVPAERTPAEPVEASAMYRSQLAGRRVLILLDNAASAEQVRPLLPGSAGSLVMVTSRQRLGGLTAQDGARRLTLQVLPPAEAHDLLARFVDPNRIPAKPAVPDPPDPVADLARACGYLPLALRIAAANLNDRPGRTIAQHVAEMAAGDRLAALTVDGDEQSAVRAAFDLSYTALASPAQLMFRLLGLVPGPDITAAAAAALAGTTPTEARRVLDRLAAGHLIAEHEAGRYRFHDLMHHYAGECTRAEDHVSARAGAVQRLLDWYLYTVDAAARLLYPETLRLPLPPAPGPASSGLRSEATREDGATEGPGARASGASANITAFAERTQAMAWLDAERPNLVAAVRYAAEHGPRPAAWLLADALRYYFVRRSFTVDWLAVAQAALAAAEAGGDLRAQAMAQLSLAGCQMRLSRYRPAIAHYTKALGLAVRAGWLPGQSAALGNLGNVHWRCGQLPQAVDHFTRALAVERRTGRLFGQATCLSNLGTVYGGLGRFADAAERHAEALAAYRELGSGAGEANTRQNLGELSHLLGRPDEALDQLNRALAIEREIGDRIGESETLRVIATVHRDMGRGPEAVRFAHAAVELARDTGQRRAETDALNTLGTVCYRFGEYRQAAEHHEQALRAARETGERYLETEALAGLAAALHRLGHPDRALPHAHEALNLARRGGYRALEANALNRLATIRRGLGEPERATELARQALAIHTETGHRLGQARTLLVLGHTLYDQGAAAAARPYWQRALEVYVGIGTPEADEVRTLLDAPLGAKP